MLRPALVCLALSGIGLTTASCGMVEGDPHRFENLADKVADIRLDGSRAAPAESRAETRTAAEQGLRPALPDHPSERASLSGASRALRVEVMDPHDLWDARDGLRRTFREESAAVAETAAPMAARAMVRQVSARFHEPAAPAAAPAVPPVVQGLRPAIARRSETPRTAPVADRTAARTTIQLGAYSTEAAARSAWARVSAGAAGRNLKGLSPIFERTTVNGRPFTRLKVAAPATAAAALCRSVAVDDPWCAPRT